VSSERPPFECPVCGESVPRNAEACPECGACEKSGWSADAAYDELPDVDFDYDRFIADEFGGARETTRKEKLWWLAAVVVVIALGWVVIFRAAFL